MHISKKRNQYNLVRLGFALALITVPTALISAKALADVALRKNQKMLFQYPEKDLERVKTSFHGSDQFLENIRSQEELAGNPNFRSFKPSRQREWSYFSIKFGSSTEKHNFDLLVDGSHLAPSAMKKELKTIHKEMLEYFLKNTEKISETYEQNLNSLRASIEQSEAFEQTLDRHPKSSLPKKLRMISYPRGVEFERIDLPAAKLYRVKRIVMNSDQTASVFFIGSNALEFELKEKPSMLLKLAKFTSKDLQTITALYEKEKLADQARAGLKIVAENLPDQEVSLTGEPAVSEASF